MRRRRKEKEEEKKKKGGDPDFCILPIHKLQSNI
jgi:hypothetical protein